MITLESSRGNSHIDKWLSYDKVKHWYSRSTGKHLFYKTPSHALYRLFLMMPATVK